MSNGFVRNFNSIFHTKTKPKEFCIQCTLLVVNLLQDYRGPDMRGTSATVGVRFVGVSDESVEERRSVGERESRCECVCDVQQVPYRLLEL